MIGVDGIGLWAPGFASLEAFRAGEADESVTMPRCAVANARAKRGVSRIARMLGEVVQQAAEDAGADLSEVPTVYASAWGEIDIMIKLLDQIADGEVGLSPLRFKHSVHNSASGLVSIAAENRGFSTAIAAGRRTFEQGVLEALSLLRSSDGERVILAVAEDELPTPLDRFGRYAPLAIGLCFAKTPREGAHGTISFPKRASEVLRPTLPDAYAANPTAHALPLLDALASGEPVKALALSAADRPFAIDVG